MDTIVEHINSAGHIFVEFALPMLIQSSVLIVILLLLDLLLRKKVKAVFRYWIWMLVLFKLILPTSLSSPLSLGYFFGDKLTYQDMAQTSATLEPVEAAPAETLPGINPIYIQPNPYLPPTEPVVSVFEPAIAKPASPPQVPVTPLSWQGVVFLVWLAVAIAMGLLLLQRALFVRGLVAQAKKAGHLMNDALSYCCASMGIKSKVGLKVSVNATTPSVCGLIRPVILMPWNLTSTLGASRLRTILMHELAHIKRGDLWVNLAQTALQIIYFYNPLFWLANCVIRRIREQAVDEAVLVAMGEKARKYPQTLVDVAKMAFKRPALSLRLIGVVESKSALAGRIKHILGRPIPKTARLGIIGLLAVIIVGAILLPMARAQRLEFAGQGGPLDIRLAGVRPDGSDDVYDGNGNKIAENTFANIAKEWGEDKQYRTFIFELPVTEEPILFSPFLKMKPTGAKRGFGTGQHPLFYYSGDKLTYSVGVSFPRTYKKVIERRVRQVDLTLRYYYGQRGAADFVFTGPFTPGQTVKAEGGADCELTATKDRLDVSNDPAAFFRISSKTRFDSDSVLVYDTSGRRYLPESPGGGSGNYGTNRHFPVEDLTLDSIAYVTVGEKPYEAAFKNVVVSYPDRPVPERLEFLDEMYKRLDLTGFSGDLLNNYNFENPADAIKVIDIVRGYRYVMKVFRAIRYSDSGIELSNLDPQAQQKVRSVAARWAKAGHPDIRAMGIRLGLVGGWPEFMDMALEWLEQDATVYNIAGPVYFQVEEKAKRKIASEFASYPAALKSEHAERIKRIILRTDSPRIGVQLFHIFWRADKDIFYEICRDLAQDERPWIWWPAMRLLSNRCTEKLRPFENLPEKMQKRLILVKEASGSSRLFDVSSSGKDYEMVAKEAYSMLPGIFTARLARMNSGTCHNVRQLMVKHLNREIATKAMTDFLREISTWSNQRLWAGDSPYFGTCCSTAYYIARHINSLYDVNIDNLGKYEIPENSETIPNHISQLKQLIAKTLQWYDGKSGENNDTGRAREIGAGNEAGQSLFSATLPNGVTVELMGVCKLPGQGKQWWAADGSLLEDIFWEGSTANRESSVDARQVVFRIRSDESAPAPTISFKPKRRLQPPGSWSGAFFVHKDNQTLEELRGCSFSLHDDQKSIDISADIGYGPWKTLTKLAMNSEISLPKPVFTDIGYITWNEPTEEGGKTTVSATLFDAVKVWRIVAVDKQDDIHTSSTALGHGFDGHEIVKATFSLPLSRIEKFRFQTRPFGEITFKNVSLRPGMKTDVQVEVEKTSQSQFSTTLPNGVRVEQPATIRVPEDYPTVFAAVEAAKAGDKIVVSAGRDRDEDILIEPKVEIEVQKTISPKLVMLLGAINSCAAETELNIESISIKARNININGDTAGRTNTRKFLDAIEKNGLEILRLSIDTRGNRDRFSIDVEPKKNWQQWPQDKTGVQLEFEKIISPKLVMLLGAINSCAAETELNIESISIKARDININGDTSSRANTRKFFDAIKKNGLVIIQLRLDTKDNRDKFSITVESKKDWQQHKSGVQVEAQGGWGEAVEGVQVRLRADKDTWEVEEKPVFKADIRNRGGLELSVSTADESCQLEIDRLWYGWSGPWGRPNVERSLLGPGNQINDISISLAKKWVGPRKALTLTAGMHTVRVAFILQRPERKYQDLVRAISNPIEIKILPAKSDVQVEGQRKAGSVVQGKVLGPRGESVEGATVELQLFAGGDVDDHDRYSIRRVTTDANGLYVFEDVVGSSAHIGRAFTVADGSMSGVPSALIFDFEIEPGRSYDITLGGKGRPVVGRLVPASGNAGDIDWSKARAYFDLRAVPMQSWEHNAKIIKVMTKAEGGNFYRKSHVKINLDGTFRIDNVRAGSYMLRVKISEELREQGFNLFRDIRIPLMPDGTAEVPLNLGSLAVSHGHYKAPRHIDNHFLDSLTLDKDIPVILKAGNDEEPDVVSAWNIRFSKDGELLTAALGVEWKSLVYEGWRARLRLLSENGSYLAWHDVFFETSKMIEKYPLLFKETLNFSLGPQLDFSQIPRFTITIQPVSEILTGNEQPGTPAEIEIVPAKEKTDVKVGTEKTVAGEWEDIGNPIPADFNDTMALTERITLGSIGQDAEGKTFITFVCDKETNRNRQYRFVLIKNNDTVLEPDSHLILDENGRLEEKFTFDEPFAFWRSIEFKFQSRSLPLAGTRSISSKLQKNTSTAFEGKTISPSRLAPPGRYAIELDGVDDYMLVPDSPTLRLDPPFTVEMWIKPRLPEQKVDRLQQWGVIAKGGYIGTGRVKTRGFGIELIRFEKEPAKFNISYCEASDSGIAGSDYGPYSFDDWIHISHVFEGGNYEPGPGHPLVVGKFLIPVPEPFMGQIGEVRIWNGARTRQEIRRYKNVALTGKEPGLAACWTFEQNEGQFAYDISGNNNHGRLGKAVEPDGADPKWVDLEAASHQPGRIVDVPIEGEREKDTSAERRTEFFGLDLTDAPRTTKWADLPDLFEARPPGSKSYHIRKDVTFVYSGFDGTVYYIPEKEIFYVRHDKLGSSTRTYYGPFNGDPHQVLDRQIDVSIKAEEAEASSGKSEPAANEDGPRITFESRVCDLGRIAQNTKHVCEFKYTNTGNALLKITRVGASCACTVPQETRECEPGESETLKVTYRTGASAGKVKKYVYVHSNDKVNPKITLTIKAEIVIKVAHEPKRLNLVLDKKNAGCPAITLTSLDNQPFSITGFKSTGDSITADFDPSVKETSFVLKPKVDMEKLGKGVRGNIDIGLTHPECKKINISFETLTEFKVDPRVVYIREAEPLKPVTKKVRVLSNYNEDFEIESTSSKNGTIKVLTQEKVRNGYQFELQITPPDQESKRRVFTDVFTVMLKGGQELKVTCYGIYSKKPAKTIEESVPKTDVQVEARVSESKAEKYEGKTIHEWIAQWDIRVTDDIDAATNALIRIGRPAVPAMIEQIKKRSNHGWRAVGVLSKMGPEAEEAVPWLIEVALDKDVPIGKGWESKASYRENVVSCLNRMTWARDRVIPVLQRIAGDDEDDTRLRGVAVLFLRDIGKEAIPILRNLTETLEDEIQDAAHHMLAQLLEKEEGLSKDDYYTPLIEKDPFGASVPEYLAVMKSPGNLGRPHPLTQTIKKLYRERLAKQPEPQLAWRLATIIQNGLRNTDIVWAAPTGVGASQWDREDPAENYATLAEVLELGFRHAEANSELRRKFGISLAKLRLLEGDWDGMNEMLQALGQEPIPKESRQWLPAPPMDWQEDLRSQWKISDESMRTGKCSVEFRIEKDGKGLKGVHLLVKRAPEPTNVGRSGAVVDTLFFQPYPLAWRYSFGYMAKDRPMTRYAVSDESGVVRFDGLPNIPIKIEVLVPTANFAEAASSWDLWMEVEPGKFKIAKKYGAGAINTQVPPAVVELKEGQTVHYPNIVVRPAFSLNVKDWDRVDKDHFTLSWQGLAPSMQTQNTEYELEMYLSAPGNPHYQATNAPVVRSAKQLTKDTQWPVSVQGVGNLNIQPGNIYMFEVRAIDASGTIIARWPRTRVWVPWAYRQSNPPFTERDTYANSPIHHGLWHRGSFGYGDGRKETLREKVARFLRDYPDAFEYEYARMGKAWLDWRDGDREGAHRRLEKLVKELPKGNVARGTAIWLIQQIDENKDPPKRLNFVPDRETSRSKAVSLPDEKTDVQLEVEQSNSESGGDRVVVVSEGKSTVYSSLKEAVDAAPAGSVLRVEAGVYGDVPGPVKTRGGISGVVVSSVTGEPIAGAYVGVGDFGDSGGSNYSRHRSQGFHDKTKTDEKGRFQLDGLAFRVHPLVVTHPDFVRHDEEIELLSSGPVPDVKVSLRPAAKIDVTIVDAQGNPLQGQWLIRLEALDGRRFIPPGSDPHLSSFASSIWIERPKPVPAKKSLSGTTGFSFTELDRGQYSIDVIEFAITDNYTPPPPGMVRLPLDTSKVSYYGGMANVKIEAGRTKEVRIKPADYQTSVSINMPQDPIKKPQIPPFVLISRNTGLLLWNDGKAHGPEDHRLGRLQKNALYYNLVVEADVFTIENLPPGSYSVFAGPIYFMSATRMEVSRGREVVVDMPPIQITEHAKVGLWTFDRKVKLQARDYSVSDLCEILTSITQSNPRIIAGPSIENEKLSFGKGQMPVWDVLEKLYLDKGWKVDEGADKTLIIRPADKTEVMDEVKEREVDLDLVIRAVDNNVTLAGGLAVELLGLTRIPIKDNPWWKPDGSPVDEPPLEWVGTDPSVDSDWEQFNYYAVATRLKGKPADKLGQTKWRFTGANGYAQTAYSNENVLAGLVRFPKDVNTTTLHLGIVGGRWETLIAFKDYGSYRKGKDSIAVSRPYGPHGPRGSAPEEKGLYIRVVYNVTDRDVRIVAVDKNGKEHLSSYGGSGGSDEIRRTIANFRDLTQEKLREYRFQVRGYEWIEFKDISLRPGKEAVALAQQRRIRRQKKIEEWLGQGQTRQIRRQILVLRESYLHNINEPSLSQVETISAIQEMVGIGAPAVPELITELRQTENWMTKSLIAFVLRAIGDERAVPALIEVLGQSKYRGGYGIYVKDDELAEFMLDNQYYPPDESDRKAKQIIIAGPVIEITKTLEKITGHSEGPDRFSPEAAEVVKSRWQKWWEDNEKKTDALVEVESASKLEEGPIGVPDYSDLKEAIKTAHKTRSELLLNSTGTANIVFETKKYSITSFEPSGSAADSAKWTTKWYKRGDKNRYDIYVPPDSRRRLPQPQDIRTVQDPNKRIYYDVIQGQAYIDRPAFKSGNPFGLSRNFDITWLYQFNGRDLPEVLAAWEKVGIEPQITEDQVNQIPCLKLKYDQLYVSKLGYERKRRVELWVAPEMAYSLVRAEFLSQRGDKLALVVGYKAAYEESDEIDGMWLLKEVTIISNQSNFSSNSERLTATFHNTKVGLDIPDKVFTFEGLGMPPSANIYDKRFLVWGRGGYGLRTALEFVPEKESYSISEQISVRLHVHNTTGKTIQIARVEGQTDAGQLIIEDAEGAGVGISRMQWVGAEKIDRRVLKLGEIAVLELKPFSIVDSSGKEPVTALIKKAGLYTARYKHVFNKQTEGDWFGSLETGRRELAITSTTPSVRETDAQVEVGPGKLSAVTDLPRRQMAESFHIPPDLTNVALNKPISSSDPEPIIGEIEMITDGDRTASAGSYVELHPSLQYVTIDLEVVHEIHAISVWHYHKHARVYFDVVVQVANDPDFTTNVRTVFNNDIDNSAGLGVGKDMHYVETNEGKLIDCNGVEARYIRLYSRGNTSDNLNHYVEVEVYAKSAGRGI